jgi:hypothetical protein
MSLTGKSMNRFRRRIDETLEDAFPVILIIDGKTVAAAGPGARSVSQYLEAGEMRNFRLPFRVKVSEVPVGWIPETGKILDWKISEAQTITLEIFETSIRPHEDRFAFTCKKRI